MLLDSHQPLNIADTSRTRNIDTMWIVDVPSDSEYVVPEAPIPRHAHNPCFSRVLHQSAGEAIVASRLDVVTAATAANAAADAAVQAQVAVSDSHDGYLMRKRMGMSGGRHRRIGSKALESIQ